MSRTATDNESREQCFRDLLGYLNFSDGTPGNRFRVCLNQILTTSDLPELPQDLKVELLQQLKTLAEAGESAFQEVAQAERAIVSAIDVVIPAYRQHHADLLFHLQPDDFRQPFFLALVFEATLAASHETGWDDSAALAQAALKRLNNYVGYRPVAILENGRRMQVYDHERFCPAPLYLKGVGVAAGPYRRLIEATLGFIGNLPEDMTGPAHFSLDRLEELCLDIRAHDHLHPVNKRTNYMFGEWDPETIDTKGFYSRFVVRRIILESLQRWMDAPSGIPAEERLFDASAVLAGTILMASAISGAGPETYDSSVSLTSLLPMVARQRDHFYQSLLETSSGSRRKRLTMSAQESRQPFGHVRHQLNMYLSQYGASQVQHRHLATFYASLGFEEAACEEATVIPCASARFESEIQSRLMLIQRAVRSSDLATARTLLTECLDLLHRGIHCGALVDPWNILGFQGMFPLFVAREDAIPDNRVEVLIEVIEQLFDASSAIMAEAAATGQRELHFSVERDFQTLAEEWDSYATTTVSDLPEVRGGESLQAAQHVATALTEWRTAGESAGDISFWREHVGHFESPRSFAQVVHALLDRGDGVAAMGLLMQWLSLAEEMGLESGSHSMHNLLHRLLRTINKNDDDAKQWQMLRRLFAFLEANAGAFWEVPSLKEYVDRHRKSDNQESAADNDGGLDLDHLFDEDGDEESDLFQAAYDDVVFRDSADDGNDSDTVDEGYGPGTTEFEVIYRQIEPRLKFLHTLGSLWSSAAVALSQRAQDSADTDEQQQHLREWLTSIRLFLKELGHLVTEVRDHEIKTYSADLDANIEYDIQMQSRFLLMQNAISTTVEFLMAERMLCSVLADGENLPGSGRDFDRQLVVMLRAVLTSDAATVRENFGRFATALQRRPLLYVPFEHGGQPTGILKARTLQAVIRMLLSQLPRLGLIEETYRLLQTAFKMERTSRPLGQAVTEFDRLFRIGLACSVEALLHAASRWKTSTTRQRRSVFRRLQRLLDAYRELWSAHSSSMRLSVVEELNDSDRADEVREFIETYGEDLFHTRMLTLGNARAIVHHGADSLLDELEQNLSVVQPVKIVDDVTAGVIGRDEATEMMEFVYEAVVDNFDRFLEYNTTTTHSDYGNRLYCLLDFLRLESLYDRFNWNNIPYQIAHEAAVRFGADDLAGEIEAELRDTTFEVADSLVDELQDLETEYGVQLPTLHDHVHERIVGALSVNRMTARVGRCSPGLSGVSEEEAADHFRILRQEIADFMEGRLGSGIEPPDWMHQLAREFERAHDEHAGLIAESLTNVDFQRVTQKEIDRQLARLIPDDE
ncbi:hypothetical protein [Fuerstiella marisgermanici]|uniref:Uncharacterized protein n=1 Tax=Fuerstiella marisgermanici TaxID=1891926 RepID=A0A1P8WQ38_9PLAN|nr:hypothetical protein [Fuerstiella marisgermanici]APZ96172.1 hypothetical protein Fuma_05840 [Fuerstiella marisgermanici]